MGHGGRNGGGVMSWWEWALSWEPDSAGEFEDTVVTVVAVAELGGNQGFEWFTRIKIEITVPVVLKRVPQAIMGAGCNV